jgi:thiol-disulfide isomerase/thioredoxin
MSNHELKRFTIKTINHASLRTLLYTTILLPGFIFTQTSSASELLEYRAKNPTPPLELMDMHGKPHSLSDYSGKVVLVNFWAGWCHPCIQEIPELIRLAEILEDKPFAMLAVNVGEKRNKLAGFVKKMDQHMVILMDTESTEFERWKGIGLPSSFVLDPAGKIRYEAYGPVNWDRPDVVDTFTALMNKPASADTGSQK